MNVRFKRLAADFAHIQSVFGSHPYIRVLETQGDPPERYKIEYQVTGLAVKDGQIVRKSPHVAEVYLPLGYPRQAPQCRMLTPVYHPNIAPHAICIGDHWSAGESLAALIARIGELITYQSYNVKSPLNGEAARWAEQNMHQLPIQEVDLSVDAAAVPSVSIPSKPEPKTRYASALMGLSAKEGFPFAEWLSAVQKEVESDPNAAALAPAIAAVVSNVQSGQIEEAVRAFAGIRQVPTSARYPQVQFLVGLLQGALGNPDKQGAAFENATRVDPTYVLAWYCLGLNAQRAGNVDLARAAFQKVVEFDPKNEEAAGRLKGIQGGSP